MKLAARAKERKQKQTRHKSHLNLLKNCDLKRQSRAIRRVLLSHVAGRFKKPNPKLAIQDGDASARKELQKQAVGARNNGGFERFDVELRRRECAARAGLRYLFERR